MAGQVKHPTQGVNVTRDELSNSGDGNSKKQTWQYAMCKLDNTSHMIDTEEQGDHKKTLTLAYLCAGLISQPCVLHRQVLEAFLQLEPRGTVTTRPRRHCGRIRTQRSGGTEPVLTYCLLNHHRAKGLTDYISYDNLKDDLLHCSLFVLRLDIS